MTLKLYSYWRSTTSFRVRAALNLKAVPYDIESVNLLEGAQKSDDYAEINPGKGVPSLILPDGTTLTQSMAILDWIEETYPEPALLPADPIQRTKVKAAAHQIALDIHPVNNLKLLGYLKGTLGHTPEETVTWMNHWMTEGFTAFQSMIAPDTQFCFGDTPGLADLCLVGQMINAKRWGCDMTPFDRLLEIDARCQSIDAIAFAMPDSQPDAT